MIRVWLDFSQAAPPALRRMRYGLFAAGLVCLGGVLIAGQQLESTRQALSLEQRNKEGRTTSGAARGSQGNKALQMIRLPWNQLFTALEQSVTDEIDVLSVQPDAQKSIVTIKAVAPAAREALNFVESLRRTGAFHQIHLTYQDTKSTEAGMALQFTVTAGWSFGS